MKCSLLYSVPFFFYAFFAARSTNLSAQNTAFNTDTLNYRLYFGAQEFNLIDLRSGQIYHIPQSWLTPPKSPKSEETEASLMQYDSVVTAFALGEKLLGIHISSYQIGEGSMALAQGLDVFLALDTMAKKVLPDVLHLGITKQRSKFMGYLNAEYTHFLAYQFPGTKYFSLGTFQEKIYVRYNEALTTVSGPFYEQSPLRWYLFDGHKWSYDADLDKYLPLGMGGELPLVNLLMSPVDWAKMEYQRRAEHGY